MGSNGLNIFIWGAMQKYLLQITFLKCEFFKSQNSTPQIFLHIRYYLDTQIIENFFWKPNLYFLTMEEISTKYFIPSLNISAWFLNLCSKTSNWEDFFFHLCAERETWFLLCIMKNWYENCVFQHDVGKNPVKSLVFSSNPYKRITLKLWF